MNLNLNQYQPLNTKESIDRLFGDLQNGKLKYSSPQQAEIDCLCEIRKINLQIYFKERFAKLPVLDRRKPKKITSKKIENLKEEIREETKQSIEKKQKKNKPFSVIESLPSIAVPHDIFKEFTIGKLAGELNWNVSILLAIFKQKGIVKKESQFISDAEYDLIEGVVESRYKSKFIDRTKSNPHPKKLSSKKSKRKKRRIGQVGKVKFGSGKKRESVYDKMATYGVGKIIYIRSK